MAPTRSQGNRALSVRLLVFLAVVATLFATCNAEYVQKNLTNPGVRLFPNVPSVPAPLVVAPDQNWLGIDGEWSTFGIRVGDPGQALSVVASTASQQVWVVYNRACIVNETDEKTNVTVETRDGTCFDARGRTYNDTESSTWLRKGFYQLWLEQNLGIGGNGLYGFDTVELGFPGSEGPSVDNVTIGTLISRNFWLGHIGLHPKPTNFSAFEDPVTSYMTFLFEQGRIPGLSFGYTAGARYRPQTFLGSLTLGGYDASRFVRNDLTFIFAPDNARDIVVGVVGIKANTTTTQDIDLLKRDSFTMYIDSTVAEIWMPIEVCKAFEDAFGLKYDEDLQMYLVDDLLHETLKAQNPSVTFTLGQKYSTDNTLDITLPYAAFDLEAKPPYSGIENKTRYFPIKRGTEEKQWVFGKTFLQEAYLIVDWERQNFSVFPVDWTYGKQQEIVAIVSPMYTDDVPVPAPGNSQGLSTGAIIGIALGGGFVFALAMCGIGWWFWRRRSRRKLEAVKAKYESEVAAAAAAKKDPPPETSDDAPTSPIESDEKTNVIPKAELPADSEFMHEMSTDVKENPDSDLPSPMAEADNTERPIFEMPGDIPTTQEAGGRQLSEKESMMVREARYNGVDPNGPMQVSPVSQDPPRRLAPIDPSEVTMVNRRLPNISPVTPRTATDGAFLEANDTFFQPPPPPRSRSERDGRTLDVEDTLLSPISPLEATDPSRRRFSYES